MIYIVLGMHKSGTTLVSKILHESGINMTDDVDAEGDYDRGNKYERSSMVSVNQDLLHSRGQFSLNFGRPSSLKLTRSQETRIRNLVRECDLRYEDWGFKDPRMCYVYDLWHGLLPEHRLIVIYRSVEEVWSHYRKAPKKRFFSVAFRTIKRWCEHNEEILRYLQARRTPHIVLNYERFMQEKSEFRRLEEFIGAPLKDERDSRMYRNKASAAGLFNIVRTMSRFPKGGSPEEIRQKLENYAA